MQHGHMNVNLLVALNNSTMYGAYCTKRVKSTVKARNRRKNNNSMHKILCKETRCHDSSVYQSVTSKYIHLLRHYHITSYLKKLQLSVFGTLHWHRRSLTVRAVLLLQEAPMGQTATSVQLQYASKHVMGKTLHKVCTNIRCQWCHMTEQYTDQRKNTASQVQCPRKIQYKNFFMDGAQFILKRNITKMK